MADKLKSSDPGTIVPLTDATQIAALAQSEAAINAENIQRETWRNSLELNRKAKDKELRSKKNMEEHERQRATQSKQKDTYVAPVQKPSFWDITEVDSRLPDNKVDEENAKETLSRITTPTTTDPLPSNMISPPKKEVFNEAKQLVEHKNVSKETIARREREQLEHILVENDAKRTELGCGTHWYCSTCDLLDSDWMDLGPTKDRADELRLVDKLADANTVDGFGRYIACLQYMGSSKTSTMVKAVADVMDKGMPTMANAAMNNIPIANKEAVFKKDIVNCGVKMTQDPLTVNNYTQLLDKTGIEGKSLTSNSIGVLGVEATDIKKVIDFTNNGTRYFDKIGMKDKRTQIEGLTKNRNFTDSLRYTTSMETLRKRRRDPKRQVGRVTNNPEIMDKLGL